MLGALITFLFTAGLTGLGKRILSRWTDHLDPAAQIGVSGILALGSVGILTLFIGLIPGGTRWGLWPMLALSGLGFYFLLQNRRDLACTTEKNYEWIFKIAFGLCLCFALIGALAPSNQVDWDSLAYHLAVPKLWIQSRQISSIPFIHHSNFPFTVENLFLWGLQWGDQAGAKAFSVAFYALGMLSVFGLTRQRYGKIAAWWSTLAFATIPAVLWESGTAYIDVANGLFTALGILFAAVYFAEAPARRNLLLAALSLGFAAGSKYTGLQTIFVVGLVLLIGCIRQKRSMGPVLLAGLLALLIAAPWYVKNEIAVGNPVFPFFYSRLGGEHWDARRSEIYSHEQQTFGIPGTQPDPKGQLPKRSFSQLGHSVLGLAYQPGRYVNPGQEQGRGFPFSALGFVVVSMLILWPIASKVRRFEGFLLASVGLSLLLWFELSQQSRYIVGLFIPCAVLAGAAVVRLQIGKIVAACIGIQALYTLWLHNKLIAPPEMQVVFGKVSTSEYLTQSVPFYASAKKINELPSSSKVALYDEVFGFYLNIPYFWANPGHSTLIDYDHLSNGEEYGQEMRRMGFTHVYISLNPGDPNVKRWLEAAGLIAPADSNGAGPYRGEERSQLMQNWELKWRVLTAEAFRSGQLQFVHSERSGILFKL